MGWRFVKQPNGLFARFSDIVDNFTHCNMDEQEAIALCILEYKMSKSEAIEKAQGGISDYKPWSNKVIGSGHDRWDEALQIIKNVHGNKESEKVYVNCIY